MTLIENATEIPEEWGHLSFRLSDDFIARYADRRPPWGFPIGGGNSLGEITWITKYSRTKPDGTKERWHEGCRRVVEGVYSILKDHCKAHRTPWNANKAARAAEDMYDRLWSMKWTPPGRGLWMMGTKFVFEEGSAALQNCFTAEQKIITRQGVMALGDIVGSEVEVWTHQGWEKAAIEEFGTQPVQSVTFGPLDYGRIDLHALFSTEEEAAAQVALWRAEHMPYSEDAAR